MRRAIWSDGTSVAIKETRYDARIEAEGLLALAAAGAPTPELIEVTADHLVLEWIDGPPAWEELGSALAGAHRNEGPAFGWSRDNLIGPLDQANAWSDSWGAFYAEHRVRVHLDDEAVPRHLAERLERACDGPMQDLLESHGPVPSLIHGDLWSGNIVGGRALIDPAVCHADREMDLAFLAFFGGAPPPFHRGYESTWPLAPGWERRRPALQLHHGLVHVRLFGDSYVPRVEAIVDSLGW